MNYRHAFHAGNFADVFKHAILVRVLMHLREKETAFRVIDTHAGAGRYDLTSEEAQRTGEWRGGIGRLLPSSLDDQTSLHLRAYLQLVQALNAPGEITAYPGSPLVAAAVARPQDRLQFCELHPEERLKLEEHLGGDRRVRISNVDGWDALKAFLPPPERRGLVLVDPPFEEQGEFDRIEHGLAEAYRRWATGIYMFWYPVKDTRETETFARRLARLGIGKILRAELAIGPVSTTGALSACGVVVVNPPWKLESELSQMLPALADRLGSGATRQYRLDWLAR